MKTEMAPGNFVPEDNDFGPGEWLAAQPDFTVTPLEGLQFGIVRSEIVTNTEFLPSGGTTPPDSTCVSSCPLCTSLDCGK